LAGLASLLLVCFVLAACDNFERDAYRTLKLAKVEYELLQEHAARRYLAGRISQQQWDRFAIAGNRFIAAHTLAADLMKTYQQARLAPTTAEPAPGARGNRAENIRRQVTAVLAELPVLLSDLHALLASFSPSSDPNGSQGPLPEK